MRRLLLPLLPTLLLLTACAVSTPIAVNTPTYHVPPVDPSQRAAESAAIQAAATSQADWQKLVTSLPQAKVN